MTSIPTIKWDGKGLQVDDYLMDHQIPRPANEQQLEEGWVTIGGHHVFIGDGGDGKERMSGPAADVTKPFSDRMTPEQIANGKEIESAFEDSFTPSESPKLPNVAHGAAQELAAAGFNPQILKVAPLSEITVDTFATEEAGAKAFYNTNEKSITLSADETKVTQGVVVHEFAHHLDNSWTEGNFKNDLTKQFKVDPKIVAGVFDEVGKEYNRAAVKTNNLMATMKAAMANPNAPENSAKLDRNVISTYALIGGQHEWMAEGVRQYSAGQTYREALKQEFPATYTAVHSILTGEFPSHVINFGPNPKSNHEL